MGRKQRNRMRSHDERKAPSASKSEFVARKVKELQNMDREIQALMGRKL